MLRSIFIVFALPCFYVTGCSSDGAIDQSFKVFERRGSPQCTGGGTTPEVMKNALITAGIDVRTFSCGIDGLAYPAVCGAPDGAMNIFDIAQGKIAQAHSLGFLGI